MAKIGILSQFFVVEIVQNQISVQIGTKGEGGDERNTTEQNRTVSEMKQYLHSDNPNINFQLILIPQGRTLR